jgi:hypothetical protein
MPCLRDICNRSGERYGRQCEDPRSFLRNLHSLALCPPPALDGNIHVIIDLRSKYSTAFSGKALITAVNGPMARSVDALALWMKVMTTEEFYQGKADAPLRPQVLLFLPG